MRICNYVGPLLLLVVAVCALAQYGRIIRGIRGGDGRHDSYLYGLFDEALYECFGIGSPSPTTYIPRPAVTSGVQGNSFTTPRDFQKCEVQS